MSGLPLLDPGILRDTLLPNLTFQTTLLLPLSLPFHSYPSSVTRSYLIPAAQVATVWWSAIGRRWSSSGSGLSLGSALRGVDRRGWLILVGVTIWGAQSIHRALSRQPIIGSKGRSTGVDVRDENYLRESTQVDTRAGWSWSWWKGLLAFIPETIFQSLISLPFTVPFTTAAYATLHCPPRWSAPLEALAIGMFGTGLALGIMLDRRLSRHRKALDGELSVEEWDTALELNSFASFLLRDSFPLFLYSQSLLHPLLFPLSPLTRYGFQSHHDINADYKESQLFNWAVNEPERYTEYLRYTEAKKGVKRFGGWASKWFGLALGFGLGGVALERLIREGLARW